MIPLRSRMLRAHHEHGADRAGEQCDGDRRVAGMAGDRAEQRDYQEIAHPGTRRIVGAGLARAADQESDRQREQKSEGG